jgi:hypothetical protein
MCGKFKEKPEEMSIIRIKRTNKPDLCTVSDMLLPVNIYDHIYTI